MWRRAFDSRADVVSETRLVSCIFIPREERDVLREERRRGGDKRFSVGPERRFAIWLSPKSKGASRGARVLLPGISRLEFT